MLLQPRSELVTREVIGYSEARGYRDVQRPFRQNKLVQEFNDIFDTSGMPLDRDTMHHIELLPNAEPHYRYQYRMYAADSTEERREVDEYLAKGWIKPS